MIHVETQQDIERYAAEALDRKAALEVDQLRPSHSKPLKWKDRWESASQSRFEVLRDNFQAVELEGHRYDEQNQ